MQSITTCIKKQVSGSQPGYLLFLFLLVCYHDLQYFLHIMH